MTEVREVTCRPRYRRALWTSVAVGAAGAGAAAVWTAFRGPDAPALAIGASLGFAGLVALHVVAARVNADAHGLRSRTSLRRWSVPWAEVADLQIRLKSHARGAESRRVSVLLRNGHRRTLPQPTAGSFVELPQFHDRLDALRALHHRYGTDVPEPASARVPVISDRTAGRARVMAAGWCVALLIVAAAVAASVSGVAADQRAWEAAVPCTAATPVAERGECLTYVPAVIARTDPNPPKETSWVYFADSRPFERVMVPREAADGFRAGDKVRLTFWHGDVMAITGSRYVWNEGIQSAGGLAAVAAIAALAAGYPAAQVLVSLRGRRLPGDEVLPSALPFTLVLAGTAGWLIPLCYLHPTTLFASATTITWAAAGTLGTAALFGWAWRATRVRPPRPAEVTAELPELDGEVFLSARFLEHTDYNPHGFGTHIALGAGPPAVTPGPGRFAARRIPVERLTVRTVRRVRGGDGDTVPSGWHIAELDDGGRLVRLGAAPDDLARILRAVTGVREPS
ncbi:PH domain-containing protein [Streptomyces sp. N50]|uniref:PH domain-containing protein n=1 Tax=Streptomyces sp. N50 TaxID=3081765 RepID=UPI002961F966|nr:PH domain-containing protein [Streptomyces sp. N50]WOX11135.1 PH domain-containing protein [Streptomyces sp. N50]